MREAPLVIDKTASLSNALGSVGSVSGSTRPSAELEKVGGEGQNIPFGEVLGAKISDGPDLTPMALPGPKSEGLRFSQHAIERMMNRGISFKPEDMQRLNAAVEKAAKKGSRESLVLMGDNAFIISVKNKTIVTAMDRETMKENIFTNIDSTVVL